MNTLFATVNATLAAALLTAAGSASAQAADAKPLTREQVIAELVAARSSGELDRIRGEAGVDGASPAKVTPVAAGALPRQAVLTVKPTEVRSEKSAAALAADHGENAARELGDFPQPNIRRTPVLAGR